MTSDVIKIIKNKENEIILGDNGFGIGAVKGIYFKKERILITIKDLIDLQDTSIYLEHADARKLVTILEQLLKKETEPTEIIEWNT